MSGISLAILAMGIITIIGMVMWLNQREKYTHPQDPNFYRGGLDVKGGPQGDAHAGIIVATLQGQVLHFNETALQWLAIEQHLPDLEQIVQHTQPAENFLMLFAGEAQATFRIGDRWIEATSSYVPTQNEMHIVVMMREMSDNTALVSNKISVSNAMKLIDDIGQMVDLSRGMDNAMQLMLEILKRDIPSDAGEICLWDDKQRFLVQRGWIGDAVYLLTVAEQGGGYRLGQGLAGWVAEHRQALLITGTEQSLSVRDLLVGTPYRSSVAMPLIHDDRFVGTVTLFNQVEDRYTPSTLAMLQVVSRTLITVIENALAYSRQEERIRDIASLQQIAEQPKAGRESTPVYAMLNERIAKLVDAEYSGIYLYDSGRHELVPQLPFHGLIDQIASHLTIPLGIDSPQDDIWHHQPYWVSNDVSDEPLAEALGLKPLLETIGVRNTALIPLQVAGERIGILAVSNRRGSGFTPSDVQNLRVLSSQAALVVENIRLYQREQLIDNELLGLQEMTHAIGALSHEGEFYAEITERIARLMKSTMCGILLFDAKERALIAQMPFFGIDESLVQYYRINLPLGSVMEEIWTDEEAWLSNRVSTDPLVYAAGLDAMSEATGVRKTLIAVMAAGGRRLGVVQVSNKIDDSDYTSKDTRLLQIFATQAGAIVENARLYREVRLRAEQADILRRVAEQAGSVLTTEQSFQPVLAEISRYMGSPVVYINVIDSTTNSLITYPRWVYGAAVTEAVAQDLAAAGYQNIPAVSGHPFITNDIANEKYVLPMYRKLAQTFIMNSAIVVPLSLGDRNLGELCVANRLNRPYTQDDIIALSTVAAQIAPALERLLLYEATGENLRRRMEELDAIARISNELSGTVELESILTVIRQELQNATDANDTTIVLLQEPATWADPATPEILRRVGGALSMANSLSQIELEAIRRVSAPVMISNYGESGMKPEPAYARSALAIAFTYLDQIVGVLHAYHKDVHHFSDRAAGFMLTLGSKASLGYQNAQYYQQQIERGQRLRQRVDQLNRIFELGHMLQSNTEPDMVLEAIAYSVQQSVGYDTVLMLMFDERERLLMRTAHAGLPLDIFQASKGDVLSYDTLQDMLKEDYRFSETYFFPAEKMADWKIEGVNALSTNFPNNREMVATSRDMWHEGDMLLVVIKGQMGNLIGLMVLDRPYDNRRPDRSTLEVLEIFGHQAATMVENTRLFLESRRSAEMENRLNEMLNAVASSLDVAEIGRAIANGMKDMLPLSRLTLALAGTEDQPFEYIKVVPNARGTMDVTQEQRKTLEGTALGIVFAERKEHLYTLGEPELKQYADLKSWYAIGEQSSFIVPLVAGGECMGVLHIGSRERRTLIEMEMQSLVLRTAQLVGSSVQNARLFNQAVNLQILNRSVVESIQQGIVVLDYSGRIITVNAFMREAYGWDDSARLQDLFGYRPELADYIKDDLRDVLELGQPRERLNQTSTEGTEMTVRNFYLYPLRSGEKVRGAVLLVEDVTERTKLEQAIESRANQLAALTDVSTRITAALEREEVINLALDEMGWIIPFDVMMIWRRNGSYMVLEGESGGDLTHMGEVRTLIAEDERIQQIVESQRVVSLSGDIPMMAAPRVLPDEAFYSWMGVPLVNQGHVVGLLVLAKTETGFYESRHEHNVAFAFASQVAIALANADLFEQTFERTNELGTLLEAAQATALTRDVSEVFRTVAELMLSALEMETCTIMIWDEVDNELDVQFSVDRAGGVPVNMVKGRKYNLLDYPARQRTLKQRDVVVIVDTERSGAETPLYMSEIYELRQDGFGARMFVPLVVREQSIGLIQLEQTSNDEQTLTQQKVRLARALGSQVAVAIENARLSTETTARFEELLTINALSQAVSSTLKLADMLPIIREQVPAVTKAEEMYLALFDATNNMITFPLAVRGTTEFYIPPRPLGTDEVSYIIKRKHTLSLGADYFSPAELRKSMGITNGEGEAKSYMGVPVKSGDQALGVLAIRNTMRSRAFSLHDDRILTTVGSQLGAAIQNARLFEKTTNFAADLNRLVEQRTEELEQERDRLDTLYQITSELARTLDMEELLGRALGMVSKAVGATDAVIMLSDPATDKLYSRAQLNSNHLSYDDEGGSATHPSEGLATWLIQNSEGGEHVIIIDDLLNESFWDPNQPGAAGLRSALAVILESNDDPMGVMVLLGDKVGGFTEQHLKLLVPAATQVATSINSADLYHLIRDQADRLAKLLRMEQDEAEKQGAILESVADGVMLANAAGKITLFNSAAERILQLPREQALKQDVTRMAGLYGASALRWLQLVQSWSDAQTRPSDMSNEPLLSERIEIGNRIISTQLSPVYSNDTFLGTVSVFRDITQDVEADRIKSDFIENVSHEFRTPLTPVKGYIEMLAIGAVGELTPMQSGIVNTILENVERLNGLLNDVLAISQISNRKLALTMQLIDLSEAIPQVVKLVAQRERNQEKNLEVNLDIERDLPRIRADRERFGQIINNLVDNAFNYTMPNGKIEITAHLEKTGQSVLITISDTGVGIAEEFRERAWKRFERDKEHALLFDIAGTGLGLPIVKELVELHNGQVWFDSKVDQGTTFYVRLPVEQPNFVTETMASLKPLNQSSGEYIAGD